VDFHALRHTFISNLAAGGVYPKTAQALARHSTITLTMDRYTHRYAGDEAAALAVLPDLSLPAVVAARATGTDDATATPTSSPTSSRAERGVFGAAGRVEVGTKPQLVSAGPSEKNTNENAGLRGTARPATSIGGGEWESDPPGTHSSPTLVLKTRDGTSRQSPPLVL
jgi:hypothetical protein